jgi:RNA polymerase sigma-70 factor (ECF subfamily)
MNDPALVPDADPPAHEQIARNQQADRLRKSLSGLPAEQQEVLHLVFMKEKTHVEAAEELEIPLGTVKSRVRLALKRVRSEIGERG